MLGCLYFDVPQAKWILALCKRGRADSANPQAAKIKAARSRIFTGA
jgi:hypothetical protein